MEARPVSNNSKIEGRFKDFRGERSLRNVLFEVGEGRFSTPSRSPFFRGAILLVKMETQDHSLSLSGSRINFAFL